MSDRRNRTLHESVVDDLTYLVYETVQYKVSKWQMLHVRFSY